MTGPELLAAALARVGSGSAYTRTLLGGPVKLTHPRQNYSGPVVLPSGRRVWFVNGEAEATNLAAADKRALEEDAFGITNPRATSSGSGDDDG